VFEFGGLRDQQHDYIDWGFKTYLKEVVHGSSAFEFIGATRQKPRLPDKAAGCSASGS
jgi:hypothetical protein